MPDNTTPMFTEAQMAAALTEQEEFLNGFKYVWKITYDGRSWVRLSNQISPAEGMDKIPYYMFDWLDFWGDINLVQVGDKIWKDKEHGIEMEFADEGGGGDKVFKVILIRGKLLKTRIWEHETLDAAFKRADSLAYLHGCHPVVDPIEGTVTVNASRYYEPKGSGKESQ